MSLATPGGRAARASSHTDFVVEQLGRAIVAGEYPSETMIPLDPDLCEMFDVSRTVVREAKKTLIAKGLIQSKAKVGTHVRDAEAWNMFDEDVLRWHAGLRNAGAFYDELFEMRLIFEPAAAGQAALRTNARGCDRLFRLADALAAAPGRADFAVADYEFHREVLRLSGNRFLLSLGDMVQTALYALFLAEAQRFFPEGAQTVAARHRDIAAAICHGDAAAARRSMRRVIEDGYARVNGGSRV
ncbi:FadR/GntR family transcriptional regulator [Mangrovicoccus algicola]|uniref:FadR family transcriptional regulator n=1 Tax=Mangrovicoccus algicola TaxID=2771008 RepID=A0A8J6YR17_9RHOB|nr:FadR/GntR family transcriptional regulator [Mangrovicoccus algicola]MBE3638013.1 FadR family transcriptional regulator [Mangrovicoccus algicola]